jgi:hypothetical protein
MIVVLAACGDGEGDECALLHGQLPVGELSDPYAIAPSGCVARGLTDVSGRWFVNAPSQIFDYSYPQFEGSCASGFRRSFAPPADLDDSDGRMFHAWSDGTLYFERRGFSQAGATFATVYCMRADDTLAVVNTRIFDGETTTSNATGARFAPRDEPARALQLVGALATRAAGTPIGALDLAVDGGIAYVAGFGGLDIIDVRNPAAPVALGNYPGGYNDVAILRGDDRIVAALSKLSLEPTELVDVTDPRAPTLAAMLPDGSHTLFVTARDGGTQLYLGTYTDLVPKYDVTHPLVPVRLGAATVPGEKSDGVHDLFVDGDRIYANYTTQGLVAFDISAGLDQPVPLGHLATSYSHTNLVATLGGRQVVLHGDEGMTGTADGGAFLRILDGAPGSTTYLKELARYQSRPEVGIHNFQLVGERLYIAYYQDGVRVLDLSNPTSPREVAHYNTWDPATAPGGAFEGALAVQVVGDLIFVADDLRGLLILRDPTLSP